jgi:U1 small nuclear ribonucleoprotein
MTGVDNPANDVQVRGDAFKTLFVARLSYDAKETDLEREFGRFGPIERVCTVYNKLHVFADVMNL